MNCRVTVGLGLVAAVIGALVLYRFDPAATALFPPCPLHALTGLHCPGCGSLRAFHALLHGDVAKAFAFNPLSMIAAPFLFLGISREAVRIASGADPLDTRAPAWSIRALLVLIVVFTVLRNVDTFSWLAPH